MPVERCSRREKLVARMTTVFVCVCVCVSGFAGTPGYLSPEVLRKDPYGKPVDVWACGRC